MKKLKQWTATVVLLAFVLALACAAPALAADTAAISFRADEPDANGEFRLHVTITDATFNVFAFALRYDPTTVIPVDSDGAASGSFDDSMYYKPSWMATVGTQLNSTTGLLSCTGYVTPGYSPVSDGLSATTGLATFGDSGQQVLILSFRRVGTAPVKLELATASSGGVYDSLLPEGAAIIGVDGNLPLRASVTLPASLGSSSSLDLDGGNDHNPNDNNKPQLPANTDNLTMLQRAAGTILLQIDNYAAVAEGELVHIYPGEKAVTPYLDRAESRTYVPARFVAEYLGAQVLWDDATRSVTIIADDKTIVMSIGSNKYTVNGAARTMDAAPRMMSSTPGYARTMVPIRFVAEALGQDVEWDQTNKLVIIAPAQLPWLPERAAEQELVTESLLLMSPLLRDFVTQ